jgi:hypothetical protein
MRLLRADILFRSWEGSIEAENVPLTLGERSLIGQLVGDFVDTLEWMQGACDHNGMVDLLRDEYNDRLR